MSFEVTSQWVAPAGTDIRNYRVLLIDPAREGKEKIGMLTVGDLFAAMQIPSVGRQLIGAANWSAMRTLLQLGTAAQANVGDFDPAGAAAAAQSAVNMSLASKSPVGHTHAQADVENLITDLANKAPSVHGHAQSDVTGLVTALAGKASSVHSHAVADVTGLQAALDGKQAAGSYAALSHTHTASQISDATAAGRALLTAADAAAQRTALGIGATAQAFVTAETAISLATYADLTGASLSLAAGTWLIMGTVVGRAVNAAFLMNAAITDGANAIICEAAQNVPASGTASVNSLGNVALSAIVTPTGTTTYKLRAARGNAAPVGAWTAVDGSAVGIANNGTSNSDKGTGIRAVRIA